MRIGIMSDSHGNTMAIDAAVQLAGAVDLWLHAGDCIQDAEYLQLAADTEVALVAGNCDWPGSSAPQDDPAVSRNSSGTGACDPGTPSILASPAYVTTPPGVCTVATATCPVFSMKIATLVSAPVAATSPRSTANRAKAMVAWPHIVE